MQWIDATESGGCRAVVCNQVAYFTGHVNQDTTDIAGQTRNVLQRYDQLLAQNHWKKERILFYCAYLDDIHGKDEFLRELDNWCDGTVIPGTVIQARCGQPPKGNPFRVELSFFVATDDNAPIRRESFGSSGRMAIYQDMAYLSGITAADTADGDIHKEVLGLYEQYKRVCETYQLPCENMVQAEILLTNQAQKDQVQEAWKTLVGENAPCGGFLYQSRAMEDAVCDPIELSAFVALGAPKEICRYQQKDGWSQVVCYRGVAYFSPIEGESAQEVFSNYQDLLTMLHMEKRDLFMMKAYLNDIEQYGAFFQTFLGWGDKKYPAAGIAVENPLFAPKVASVQFYGQKQDS